MNLLTMIFFFSVFIAVLFFYRQMVKLRSGNWAAELELAAFRPEKLSGMGSVGSLSVLPLVEYYSDDPSLVTEPGVSYLVRADDFVLLMDAGFNIKKEHPSPLLRNMQKLGVELSDIDAVFISHIHRDHIGGKSEERRKQLSLSRGSAALPEVPLYAPEPLSPSSRNPGPRLKIVNAPEAIAPGVASTGPLPRNLFLMGYIREQVLAVNLKGRGIVLIIGCGHPGIEKISERASQIFNEPVYGIIGGLHFPVRGGRLMAGPVNLQNIVGSDRPPWKYLNEKDVFGAIDAVKRISPEFISLSPHDSSDWSLEQFKKAFGDRYHELKAGRELLF